MASGGDERGNLFQRTSSAIMYRNSDEDNEDETETANQNEKRLPPSPANNMNNQKNKAIPASKLNIRKFIRKVFSFLKNKVLGGKITEQHQQYSAPEKCFYVSLFYKISL